MMKNKLNITNSFVILLIIINLVLWDIPTGFEKTSNNIETTRCKGQVIEVDNSTVRINGIVKTGTQSIKFKVLNGKFKGQEVEGPNYLMGKLELDKMFTLGDKALIVIEHTGGTINHVNVIDHYRINLELILLILFSLILIILAGWIGVKAILSFVFTILVIWKVLMPSFLKGYNPILVSLIIVIILTFVIIFLVADFTKKGVAAFIGATLGVVLTCILAVVFGRAFNIHGAVVPFSETLLYSGFPHLDLTKIFFSGIFLASSGAVMDVAMDISAAINEVVDKKPDITTKEAILSGMNVSKAVLGTMTTTLLLAYSGGYTGMLMVFMAQGTPATNIFNITYVSSEILHTLVGSFGLVMVAPFTSIVAGIIFTKEKYNHNLT